MRLREHDGIIQGRIDILYCKPSAITLEEGYNVRDLTTAEARAELDELKAQVKEHGVLTPLKIRFNGEQIILVEGHRRRTVALELIAEYEASGGAEGRNIEAVPIFPEAPGTTVEDRDAGLLVSNTGSRLKPLELANLIYRMNTVRGMPLEMVAKRLQITMPVLKNHLDMRAMSEPIKEHVREGNISATLAAKISKNADPVQAEEMIRANMEENKRLNGKKRVTPKTIARNAKPKSDPKPDHPQTKADMTPPFRGDMMHREIAYDAGLPAEDAADQKWRDNHDAETTSALAATPETEITAGDAEAKANATQRQHEDRAAAPQTRQLSVVPRSGHGVESLLSIFIHTTVEELASACTKLGREHDEANAIGEATEDQEILIGVANGIGRLRFGGDWEGAKANSELAQVA